MNLEKLSRMTLPALVAGMVIGGVSCVNEAYDLSKGIDLTIDVNGDISAPVGSTQKILIGDFLKLDDTENSVITQDADGNYLLSVSGDEITQNIDVPSIEFSDIQIGNNDNPGGFKVTMDIPDNEPVGQFPITADRYDFEVDGSRETEILISEDVPDYVSEIGRIDLQASLGISLTLSRNDEDTRGEITIAKGFTLKFPDYITIAGASGDGFYAVEDGHVVKFIQDVNLKVEEPRPIELSITAVDFNKLPEGQGLVGNKIQIEDAIVMDNVAISAIPKTFGIYTSDLPQSLAIDIDMTVSDIAVRTVQMKFNPEIEVGTIEPVELGEMPEFLSGENTTIDIYSPVISMLVTNTSPVSVTFSADITSYSDDNVVKSLQIGSPDQTSGDAIVIGKGVTPVYIVRRAEDVSQGAVTATNDPVIIVKDDLAELVATMPDRIEVTDVNVAVLQEMLEVDIPDEPDAQYSFSFNYSIDAPLAFGENLSIEYPYDITGLNDTLNSSDEDSDGQQGETSDGNLQIHLTEASVYMTFVNEIPLTLAVSASPIDVDGNVIASGVEVSLSDASGASPVTVKGGDTGSATTTPAVIHINADLESLKRLDGFRLNLKGSCDSDFAGVALNSRQGIQLTDISVNIKGGISTQL